MCSVLIPRGENIYQILMYAFPIFLYTLKITVNIEELLKGKSNGFFTLYKTVQ